MARLNVRARAVDLLGRQQVAGIPTAISELFKNAHDAYANQVDVDFYRGRQLVILRDDGVGMSRADFQGRWLTIGTESKAVGSKMPRPPVDPSQRERPVMGEKGIGRLAIALIGAQVLILTRPKYGPDSETITAAFINWSVFSLPGIDLADVEIPIVEFPDGRLPNATDVDEMVDVVRRNIIALADDDQGIDTHKIITELDLFKFDPAAISLRIPEGPDLRKTGGTQFWILPVNEILADDIDGFAGRYKATPLEKVLLGFSNTMTPGHPRPPIETRFRDHLTDGTYEERIADGNFFTPEEFSLVDHHVDGRFDTRGQFTGTVRVYGGEAIPYQVRWPGAEGKDTLCGPVSINFAYLQGNSRDSLVPKERHDLLVEKLNKIGGLYIYRDGIRILPYGDADYDFLDIEGRRTRSAGYYFFSYRRMFGVIEISRKENSHLLEKAGREGFQENRAYRQMRDMLENFFVQAAGDFFREDGAMANVWEKERGRINKEKELLAKRSKLAGTRRTELATELDKFFEKINSSKFEIDTLDIVSNLQQRLITSEVGDLTVEQLMALERGAREAISAIVGSATVKRPKAVGLTRDLSRAWARYEVEFPRLDTDHFRPALARIDDLVVETTSRLDLNLTARQRVTAMLEDLGIRERRRAKSVQSGVHRNLIELRQRALGFAREGFLAVETTIRSTLVELERTGAAQMSGDAAQSTRERLEMSIVRVADEQVALLERLRDQLKIAATPEALEQEDVFQAVEGELEERRERDFESLQLAQMGAAIGIVHHEFHAVIRVVRHNIRQLQAWAAKNPKLDALYREIRDSYSHLDSYLSLFAPLNRRLYRQKRVIKGQEIYNYIDQLLGTRIRENHIRFTASTKFLESRTTDFVPNIYPAFVNLLDNAVFWLTTSTAFASRPEDYERLPRREILLDYENGAFIISDNGPGVLSADRDAIFDSGFSRKPGGSGLGLYITKSLLDQAGYKLELDPQKPGHGATFRISIPEDARGSDDHDRDEDIEG